MRRRNNGNFREERDTKRLIYIATSILIIAILAFVITFLVYSNALNNDPELADKKVMK